MSELPVIIRDLGQVSYLETWQQMQNFTLERDETTVDEIWLLEHEPVFTQGQAGKAEHILNPGDIPIVKVDRGGQVTYHGPGQLVAYVLLDMTRIGSDVRKLVSALEASIVNTLAHYDVKSAPKADAPGVYVEERKICSLGLRIKKGKSFHGLALNINMDLEPFLRINPCGYAGLEMTQLNEFTATPDMALIKQQWVDEFCQVLAMQPKWDTQ
ncbi:lipoyl(octanoyl) transferase LipB [Reinekea sp.]|uniref:lipoyl(octanoyl) transferase LipB n=1 Tax=Reinekea sp. TaxID=1970455 RepID=UPI00398A0808